jgi:O-antigen ligase
MDWWRVGWEMFRKSPIYGYGFGAGVRYVVFNSVDDFVTATMHNSWLEILVNVGIVGLIPVAFVFIGTWWTLLRISFRPPAWFDRTMRMLFIEMIGLFIILSVHLITGGSSFLHDREILLFLLVVAYAQQIKIWQKAYKARRCINTHSFDKPAILISRAKQQGNCI